MMNKITNLERSQQQATKPPFRGQPQRSSQAWKPRAPNEQRVPNTLDPSNVISQEETPWCLPCGDSHWEHECPRSNGEPDHMNVFDTINSIFSISPQECLNITPEQLEEGKREATRRARMEIINKMDEESREKLRKKELQVYTRQRSAPQAPPSDPRFPQPRPPPPPTNNPPPSSTLPKTSDIDLNIDINGVLEKINVHVPLTEIIKIPSMRSKVEKFFRVQGEPVDPPIMLQANHFRPQYDEHPPFFISLQMNNKRLNNCMLDSGAGANVMALKVMRQLGLEVTRPYRNVCGIESRAIPTHGVIENVEGPP
jgi:hypothetical protein